MIEKPTPFQRVLNDQQEINKTIQENLVIRSPVQHTFWSNEQGVKFDQEKSRMDLIDSDFLVELGDALRYGAKKYATHNWRSGLQFSRITGALMRHLAAFNKGEDIDPESGLPHTAHIAACSMFLSWTSKHRKDCDDRYKYDENDHRA